MAAVDVVAVLYAALFFGVCVAVSSFRRRHYAAHAAAWVVLFMAVVLAATTAVGTGPATTRFELHRPTEVSP